MSFWKRLFGKRTPETQQTKETTGEDTTELDTLVARLEDPVWDVRYEAIESLGKLKNGKAIIPILECVGRDKNFRVRGAGLRVLKEVFNCLDDRMIATVQARWDANCIDPNDHESGFERPTTSVSLEQTQKSEDYRTDPFIATCLDFEYREVDDDRWFSHFEELPQIDSLRKNGKREDALSLCLKGLERYPDSFLFYNRAAELYDQLDQPDEAEKILKVGLSKSLSKCSIAGAIADLAFGKNDYRNAIRWWITAGVLQLESKIMVDKMPFLNLAYVCQPIGIEDTEHWLLSMADRASSEGPIRFNAEGAELRHQVARAAMAAGDDAAQHAIVAFYERYR